MIINLRDISRMMRMQYEGKASQKRILIILYESGVITQKKLTERLGIKPGSSSEILSKMENAGLIVRRPNDADRRTTDVLLTERGRACASEASNQRKQRHKDMFACLSEEEKTILLSLLEKIRTDWENKIVECREPYGVRSHRRYHHRG
ncbi:MAG: MarR family winged helix-turn-helix transcriptional regulator [Christensenellales bacterium]